MRKSFMKRLNVKVETCVLVNVIHLFSTVSSILNELILNYHITIHIQAQMYTHTFRGVHYIILTNQLHGPEFKRVWNIRVYSSRLINIYEICMLSVIVPIIDIPQILFYLYIIQYKIWENILYITC